MSTTSFEVRTGDLRDASGTLSGGAEQVVNDAVAGADPAMFGSFAAGAGPLTESAASDAARDLQTQMQATGSELAQNLGTAADQYDQQEAAASAKSGAIGAQLGAGAGVVR